MTQPPKSGDDVIDFAEAKASMDGPSSITIVHKGAYCRHMSVLINETRRTIECARCEAQLDPFSVLVEYARHERTFSWAEKNLLDIRRRVEELKKEERRVKARVKRATEKAKRLITKPELAEGSE